MDKPYLLSFPRCTHRIAPAYCRAGWLAPILLLALLLAACQVPTPSYAEAGPAATLTAWRLPTDAPQGAPTFPPPAQNGEAAPAQPDSAAAPGELSRASLPQQMPIEPPERPSAGPRHTQTPTPAPPPPWNPAMASDLLFLAEDLLVRWDPFTQSADLLADDVTSFTPSPVGRTIVLLRPANIAANGVERFDLLLLDLQSGQTLRLLTQTPHLYHLAISPDGQRLVYLDRPDGGTVFSLRLPTPSQPGTAEPARLGTCQPGPRPGCTPPAWSPDSLSLLWLDERGAWLSNLRPDDPRLIQPVQVTVSDPRGGTSQMAARFSSPAWSPTGRFVLLTVAPLGSQVSWQAVMDTRGERLVKIPDSYRQSELENSAAWLENGDLVLAHAGGPLAHSIPYIQHYRLFATRQELLDLLQTYDLFTPPAETSTLLSPTWLSQPDQQGLLFLLQATSPTIYPGLYRLNLGNSLLEQLADVPFTVTHLSWSPDGQSALLMGVEGQAVYFPFGGAPVDLSPYLAGPALVAAERFGRSPAGAPALDFSWLPPRPRPRQTAVP